MSGCVLGVDPGTQVTGYGVVEPSEGGPGHLIECGVVRTDPKAPLWQRLDTLYDGLCQLIERHHPTALALENAFYAKNVRTTLTLGHARGVILLAGTRAGLEIAEYAPRTIKKCVTGNGGAGKAQVGVMVQRLLRLKTAPSPSDAADGVAAALTYLMERRP